MSDKLTMCLSGACEGTHVYPHGLNTVVLNWIYPQIRNVTTSMVGIKNSHIRKHLTNNGEPQR